MNTIRFSHNWNGKLSQNVFTTIRNHTDSKYHYYLESKKSVFDVWLKGSGNIKQATLIDVCLINYSDIPFPLIATDTGIVDEDKALGLFEKFGMEDDHEWMIVLTFESLTPKEK